MTERYDDQVQAKIDETSKCGGAVRVPICLLVDASYSMTSQIPGGQRRVDAVNNGIRKFIRDGRSSISARDAIDLSVIAFGGTEAEVLVDFRSIKSADFPGIHPNGGSPLSAGVRAAVTQIDNQMNLYAAMGLISHRAHLIVISDGEVTDDANMIDVLIRYVRQKEREIRMDIQCFCIGDDRSGQAVLQRLDSEGELTLFSDLEINQFFEWVSKSADETSKLDPSSSDARTTAAKEVKDYG